MGKPTEESSLRGSSVPKGTLRLHRRTNPSVAKGRIRSGTQERPLLQTTGDRHTIGTDKGQHVEREATYCANCVNLLYLEGVLHCAEYNFLLTKKDLQEPIDCPKYLPLSRIHSLKIFTGRANKMKVTEQLVEEVVIKFCTQTGVPAPLNLIHRELQMANRSSIFDILERLIEQKRMTVEKVSVKTNKASNTWLINCYWPVVLDKRFRKVFV